MQLLLPVAALLLSVAFMMVGHGMQATILPLWAQAESFSALAIGALASSYFFGFLLGSVFGPYFVLRAGHIRAFAAIVSVASAASLLHPMFVSPLAWIPIRALTGFCLATLYTIIESWLNERTDNANRGYIMSVYVIINFAFITLGQVMVPMFELQSYLPFAVASIVLSLAIVPITMTQQSQPAPIAMVRFRPRHLYNASPVAFVGAILFGLVNGSIWNLAPLYATGLGFSTDFAAYFAGAIVAGGIFLQWPIGRYSDGKDRRVVLMFVCIVTAALAFAIGLVPKIDQYALLALAFVLGGFLQPIYSLITSHAYDHTEIEDLVETSASILLAYGAGSTIGPLITSSLIGATEPAALFFFSAVFMLLLAGYAFYRVNVRDALPVADQTDYDLGSTASLGGIVTPEPLDEEAAAVEVPEPFWLPELEESWEEQAEAEQAAEAAEEAKEYAETMATQAESLLDLAGVAPLPPTTKTKPVDNAPAKPATQPDDKADGETS